MPYLLKHVPGMAAMMDFPSEQTTEVVIKTQYHPQFS